MHAKYVATTNRKMPNKGFSLPKGILGWGVRWKNKNFLKEWKKKGIEGEENNHLDVYRSPRLHLGR